MRIKLIEMHVELSCLHLSFFDYLNQKSSSLDTKENTFYCTYSTSLDNIGKIVLLKSLVLFVILSSKLIIKLVYNPNFIHKKYILSDEMEHMCIFKAKFLHSVCNRVSHSFAMENIENRDTQNVS